jgi:antitoxin CcdA
MKTNDDSVGHHLRIEDLSCGAVATEVLLTDQVNQQKVVRASRRKVADACCATWNDVHARVGSFADEHCTL